MMRTLVMCSSMSFSNIQGQSVAIETLQRAWNADRLPHGLIFAGPAGVGKATTARALGKLFLCESSKDAESCDACDSCRVFEAGNHPDYHVITKELIRYHDRSGKSKAISLSIDVIRPELLEPAGRKASMGRGKVFVIEQADLMTAQAQNAMLKTLEEPAGRSLIVLLTDQAGALLPTIRSRCQVVRFAALDEALVARELARRDIDKKLAARAAELSGGSLGVALKWIEDGVVAPADELCAQIDALLDAGQAPEDLPGWFKSRAEAYAQKQLERDELGSKDQANREGLGLYLHVAAEHCRRRMTAAQGADELERACAIIDALVRAEQFLDANVNIALVFQQLAATLERQIAGVR